MNMLRMRKSFGSVAALLLFSCIVGSLLFILLIPSAAMESAMEDEIVEYASAMLLFLSALVTVFVGFKMYFCQPKQRLKTLAVFALGVCFFILGGEEISWGQRLFDIVPGSFFQKHNWQQEINFHNLHTDIANISYHYGALVFLVLLPLMRKRINTYLHSKGHTDLSSLITPEWIVAPSIVLFGMIDPRFIFVIEKGWAAFLYLVALCMVLSYCFITISSKADIVDIERRAVHILGLMLIVVGIYISYIQAIDSSPNTISEYKELLIALCLFLYSIDLHHRGVSSKSLPDKKIIGNSRLQF